MKHSFYGLIFLSAFFFTSCGNESQQKYLQEVDEMEAVLDSLYLIAFNAPLDRIPQDSLIASVRKTLNNVKRNYNSDTIDYEMAKKLDAYKEIENALSINSGNLAKAKQAIEDTQKKVEALEYDIRKGINDRNSYQNFIEFEKNKIKEIENVLEYYLEKHHAYQTRYDSLHPVVLELVAQLEKKKHE
ncbi:MAG TPA: hypothetical protein VKX31_07635 [Brumimicrobium sp.]|nr:hypothetical protein [Brumimicrobium sp.]